jgi:hypothetical protein
MKSKINLPLVIKIHKIIGVCLALWLGFMAITGILLNHSSDLSLDKTPIQSSILLNIYGVKLPKTGTTFVINQNISVHLIGSNLFWNNQKILNIPPIEPYGLVASTSKEVLIYWPTHLALFNLNGELVELKQNINIQNADAIGTNVSDNFYIKSSDKIFQVDANLEFKTYSLEANTIQWSISKATDRTTLKNLNLQNLNNGINYERLIIDIHNGNIFGCLNKFLIDFLSIFFVILIFSGLFIWFQKMKLFNKHQ